MAESLLVIGSNSFSGASFVDFALRQGADVLGASRSPEPAPVFLPYRWADGRAARFRFHQLDLNHDLDALTELIERERPAYVVNFAAQSMVGESWRQPEHWFQTNVVATVNLHERLRRFDLLKRYVHVTTPEVYGSTKGFIREDAPFAPSTPYAVSRAAADMSLRSYHAAYGFPVVFTRAANVYGPGQQLYRIIPRTILFLLTGRRLKLHGGGASRRAFLHIEDVASATWQVMTTGRNGESYHISPRDTVTIRDLVERLCGRLGARFEDSVEMVGDRLSKDAAYELDSTRIRNELGWSERIALDEGLDQCVAWVRDNLDELKDCPSDYVHKA